MKVAVPGTGAINCELSGIRAGSVVVRGNQTMVVAKYICSLCNGKIPPSTNDASGGRLGGLVPQKLGRRVGWPGKVLVHTWLLGSRPMDEGNVAEVGAWETKYTYLGIGPITQHLGI